MDSISLSATGGFGVLVPSKSAMCKRPIYLTFPKCQLQQNETICTYILTNITFGVYEVYLHDIEHDGLLRFPFSSPAVSILETVLG